MARWINYQAMTGTNMASICLKQQQKKTCSSASFFHLEQKVAILKLNGITPAPVTKKIFGAICLASENSGKIFTPLKSFIFFPRNPRTTQVRFVLGSSSAIHQFLVPSPNSDVPFISECTHTYIRYMPIVPVFYCEAK